MLGNEIGRRIARAVRSPRAARLDAERSARIDAWAGRHRVLTTLAGGVIFALLAWYTAARRDGATVPELVVYEVVLVPFGMISAWIACTRIRRRSR